MVDLPRFADELQQQTTLKIEEFSGPVETDVQQSNCHLEGQLYEHFVSMLILELQTDSAGDKIDIDWPPVMVEPILMVDSLRFADELQQQMTLHIEKFSGQIKTDMQQSSCDPVGSPNQGPVSNLEITETKPRRRALWKRIFCCAC